MSNLNRLTWAARHTASGPRRWTPAEVRQLESLVGKMLPRAIAQKLDRPLNSIISKLRQLGYRMTRDVMTPLGLSAIGLSRRLNAPMERVWRDVRSGLITATRPSKRDYLISWPEVRKYEARLNRIRAKRQRALDRITEPTLTKSEFMALVGLQETHATRYCQYGIVKGWKIPCKYQDTPRDRWEWVISKADAERVKQLREAGKLRLSQKRYRNHQIQNTKTITNLRRSRRLGLRPVTIERKPVIAGWYTIVQVAHLTNTSESKVYEHVRLGRLKSKSVPVGRRPFIAIEPTQIPAYVEWCQRPIKATGPLQPHRRQIASVRATGYLTITDAAQQFNLKRGTLNAAVAAQRIPSKVIDGMRALKPTDVQTYRAQMQPR